MMGYGILPELLLWYNIIKVYENEEIKNEPKKAVRRKNIRNGKSRQIV
jgi:hypothetical protein